MNSSFLAGINLALAIYSASQSLKIVFQFGLPNHPAKIVTYLVTLSACAYFVFETLLWFDLIPALEGMRWRSLPLVAGGLGLLLQVVTTIGQFSLIQQKVISRLPLMAGLLCFAFFPDKANLFFCGMVALGGLFLSVSVGKARMAKRHFFKMALFLCVGALSPLALFFFLLYFFQFEQTFSVAALAQDYQ